ncbi:serine hydrolase [Aurantimonas sp. Leaf443]|uniref:serine hydrolase n=1 Tax=Aurantimonas sp. Leaf443 TaxID=1736378 RepID=UPI000A44D570|nr:serine hydrolase [Aurantimonas sp. Leaf443]
MKTSVFTCPRLAAFGLGLVLCLNGAARAESSIAVDVATGKVLAQDNATERRYPASTTKLMTAYVALKALKDGRAALDTPVIVTRRAAAEPPSKMGFKPGSVVRLDVALRMMLVKSANDIAFAIGQTLGNGSIEAFVAEMNATAASLGMADTHFVNANGLPGEGQYSSAKDLAILGLAIRRDHPAFTDYFGTEAIRTGAATMENGNKLLGRYDGADGMKTGYICASGFNLVSSATRGGRTIVAVVLGADGPITRERESAAILEAGFKTDPATVSTLVTALPRSAGAPIDISETICSSQGRTARANERQEETAREETFGSPFLHDLKRPPVAVPVALGGAAGNALVEPGVTVIAAYGIPIPTPRPADLGLPAPAVPETAAVEGAPLEGDPVPTGPVATAPGASNGESPETAPPAVDAPATPAARRALGEGAQNVPPRPARDGSPRTAQKSARLGFTPEEATGDGAARDALADIAAREGAADEAVR